MSDFQIFTDEEIHALRKGGRILHACLEHVAALVQPGVQTAALDKAAEEFIRSHEGAVPAFKGYRGFPAALCTSVNEQCVHGLPGSRALLLGDIVSLDCGVLFQGLYTDACVTVGVGAIGDLAEQLLRDTEQALQDALAVVRAGARVGDISARVQRTAEAAGFFPVRALTGHGLGRSLHQFPDIPNIGKAGTGPVLPARTILAIEPIVAAGTPDVREEGDGWTISTVDGSLAAHFEHTVLVLEGRCEVLA